MNNNQTEMQIEVETLANQIETQAEIEAQALVNQYLRQAQSVEALEVLDRAIAEYPHNWQLWNERSVLQENLGQFDLALAGYDRMLQLQLATLQLAQTWYNRGNVLMRMEQLETAILSYDRALDLSPELVDALNNRAIAQEKLGDYAGAISTIVKAIQLQSTKAEFHFNHGVWLLLLDSFDLALECFDRALAIRPGYSEAWYRRGNLLEKQNREKEAIASYRQALAVNPHSFEVANDLGVLLEKRGDFDQARQSYEKAIALKSDFYSAWYNLGNTWQKLDCYQESIKCYGKAIEFNQEFAEAHCNLGVSLDREQQLEKAITCFKEALFYRPDYPEAERNLKSTYQKLVPRWHFVMLNDRDRNQKYDIALRKIVDRDSIVLDIGAGSGLLAMMAARAGASQVITCEMVPAIAEAASEIIEENGFSQQISVIAKKSTNLEVGIDLPERANILVTETFDVGLLGEEALISLRHAIEHLITPDAKILPAHAKVFAQLVECEQLHQEDFVENASGFEVSIFNRFALTPNYLQRQLNQYSHRNLTDVQEVFSFDFAQVYNQGSEASLTFPILLDGKVHAVVFWFELWLDSEIKISTSPQTEYTHWQQAIQLLEQPLTVKIGGSLTVKAVHDCTHIKFVL
jgi:tetratricopeptide (TPR) repeat protein